MIDVSIITISTNELHYLKNMYFSLKKWEGNARYELIVIDNNSSDGTSDWLKEKAPEIMVIKNRKKQGFAFNNNIGIKRSIGKYILILNPDVIFIEPILNDIVTYMDKNDDIGLLTCKLLNKDSSLQNAQRRFYNLQTMFVRRFPIYRELMKKSLINKRHLYYYQDKGKIFYPDWILGAFMLIKREVINTIGFFDERFILYFEDVDYCRRIWKNGYKIVYYPYKSIIHLYNRESDTKKLFKGLHLQKGAKIHLQSMIKYLKKYKGRSFGFT